MDDFDKFEFSFSGVKKNVYKLGSDNQPAVLLMIELPGMTKHTVDFARRLHRDGYTVYLPLLFGRANSPMEPLKNVVKICIQKEFNLLAFKKPSLITEWLRALCREMKALSKQPVGAIGMCFTGGFVLSLMVDDSVAAPVMSQPGTGGFFTKKGKSDLGVPDEDIENAIERSLTEDVPILGFRFTHDVICPKERFDALEKRLGNNFIRMDIDSSLFNKHGIPIYAHSVHTLEYNDAPGHPTRLAYERLLEFLKSRLHP